MGSPPHIPLISDFVVSGFLASAILEEKINKPLSRIHKPVVPYDNKVAKSVQRMFDNLKVDRPLWRANWYLYDNPELFTPLTEKFSHTTRKEYFEGEFWVRVERQTLTRLPNTNSIVFGIHTYVVNKKDLNKQQVTSLKEFKFKNFLKDFEIDGVSDRLQAFVKSNPRSLA